MEKKIYLPNEDTSLKEYTVYYNFYNVLEYINNKSIEMGAKVEEWGIDPREYFRNINDGERLSVQSVWCPEIETHDFWNGMSENSHFEDRYTIFSNEQPIIKDLLSVLETKKTCLGTFKKKGIIFEYVASRRLCDETLKDFFDKNYIDYLSFESLIKHVSSENIILEFLDFFNLERETILSYDKIKKETDSEILLAQELYEKKFLVPLVEEPVETSIFEYIEKEFINMKSISKKNERILRLKK